MAIKYARCTSCKDYYLLSHLVKRECNSCVFTTYRCKGCDGAEGAERSLRGHTAYWRTRGEGAGGHDLPQRRRLRVVV